MPVWKPVAVQAAAAPAAAAVTGSGQASTATQTITTTQSNNQSVVGNNNTINPVIVSPPTAVGAGPIASQTNSNTASNYNVPVNIQVKDVAVAWDNSTATSAQ